MSVKSLRPWKEGAMANGYNVLFRVSVKFLTGSFTIGKSKVILRSHEICVLVPHSQKRRWIKR